MSIRKRITGVVTAACCLCSAMLGGCASSGGNQNPSEQGTKSAQAEAASDSTNESGTVYAVKNDFEINYDGWIPSANAVTLRAEDGMGNENSRGMVVTGRKKARDGVYSVKGMYLSGNVDYTYSVMVYSDSAETFTLNLACAEKGSQEKNNELVKAEVEAGKWTELKADFTAPEGSGTFKLSLVTDSTADFRFDDVTVVPKDPAAVPSYDEKGLKDAFADYFKMGNILNSGSVKNHEVLATVLKNYNSITCENEMKPDSTLVQSQCKSDDDIGVSIKNAIPIMDFCASNGISMRGHVLVWHSQTPGWFFKEDFKNDGEWVTPEVMDKRLESYIKNLFELIKTQYPGLDLYAYDVVNEAVSDDSMRNILYGGAREGGDNNVSQGKSGWVKVYGDNSFIEKAFTYARKYAPEGTKLFYNDYNEYWDHKRDKIFDMCKNLYEKGLLDGVGMQSHVNGDMNGFSGAPGHKNAMLKYLSIGCEVQFTEIDINCEGGKYSAEQQAEKIKAMVQAAVDYNSDPTCSGRVTAVCFWGPNDANTWISPENTPLLHDKDNQPKPAYDALMGIVPEEKWGDGHNTVKYDMPKKELNLAPTDADSVTAVHAEAKEEDEPEETEAAPEFDFVLSGNYSDGFEEDECGWIGRGAASVEVSRNYASDGEGSLYITGRTDAWNGAFKMLDPEVFVPGEESSFKVKVMFNEGGDTDTFYMKLQYVDESGTTQYASVAEGEAKSGEWITLENASYLIPDDASFMQIYVETAASTNNFYVDEAEGAGKAA